ncbi:MAG: ribonuclease III [Planctomycetota bacterium]|nr:MAG: ribonuclease III [Planctomycetota bacterium]REJ91073.1 MAG: ribonuclease III [Planctomycetota bacterium]REK22192.1 MAG: ribonuclease III [Planctomycetota bacterium]REK44286.1 MAG: ribonuclease III [Planctomycetota bacterium]
MTREDTGNSPTRDGDELLAACEERIGHAFADRDLLTSALTHASGAEHRLASNERLEFLGDAILGAVVCEKLFHGYPTYQEGDLTKIKSMVVSRQTCARVSSALGLEEFLILGKGMSTHANVPPSLLSDVFESLVAAIYLDGGDGAARSFIEQHIFPEIELAVSGELGDNYKSQLQQLVQRLHGNTPNYHLLDEQGPDHSKHFKVAAEISGQLYAAAWGRNKKEAEQRAAENALSEMDDRPVPYSADELPGNADES